MAVVSATCRRSTAHAEDVGLELHESCGGAPSTVLSAQFRNPLPSPAAHRASGMPSVSVARTMWFRLPRGRNVVPRAYANPNTARPGRQRPDHIHAIAIGNSGGHRLGLFGTLNQFEFVTQPLHGGAGHEDTAFQRVINLAVDTPGDGRQQAVFEGTRCSPVFASKRWYNRCF